MKLSSHRLPGLVLTDHEFLLPLDHASPGGGEIRVFAREVVATEKEDAPLPWLLFLQGGPGRPAPRPLDRTGWLRRALEEYRVLLLDQRGTGRSSPATFQTLAAFQSAKAQAEYLRHFRADAIVKDAERIRRELLGEERWFALGQSYGGFCLAHYLSAAPGGLAGGLFTGGLPPLAATADDVYRRTYPRLLERNRLYYARYPDDVGRVHEIVRHLTEHDVDLPSGGRLSPARFQQLGLDLGMSEGFETIHYLIEEAFVGVGSTRELSYTFLRGVESATPYLGSPLFSLLHEAIYAQQGPTTWAAERLRPQYRELAIEEGRPVFFTGEMIYRFMFDEISTLRPLKKTAEILASYRDWPRLYDPNVLARNEVPCAAVIYHDDMYVDRDLSLDTARAIRGLRFWLTNEFQHNGLRADGERILGRLLDLLRGKA